MRYVIVCCFVLTCLACEVAHPLGSDCAEGVCSSESAEREPTCLVHEMWSNVQFFDVEPGWGRSDCKYRTPAPVATTECRLYVAFDGIALPSGQIAHACEELPFFEPLGAATEKALRRSLAVKGKTACLVRRVAGPERAEQGWYETDHDTDPADIAMAGHSAAQLVPKTCVSVTQAVPIGDGLEYSLSCTGAETVEGGRALHPRDAAQCSLPDVPERKLDVGESCMTALPEFGWLDTSVYVETGSQACDTGVCLTYQFDYFPNCGSTAYESHCVVDEPPPFQAQIDQRSYCSCRCDAPPGDPGSLCSCKEGFSCVPTLFDAPPGLRGSYCVRDHTFISADDFWWFP